MAKLRADISIVDVREKRHDVSHAAPGQLLTHYAPDVPAYLCDFSAAAAASASTLPFPLSQTVVVDLGGQLSSLAKAALASRDLSSRGDAAEACVSLFDTLRWSETVPGAKAVLLPDAFRCVSSHVDSSPALADRLFRAASGRRVAVPLSGPSSS